MCLFFLNSSCDTLQNTQRKILDVFLVKTFLFLHKPEDLLDREGGVGKSIFVI